MIWGINDFKVGRPSVTVFFLGSTCLISACRYHLHLCRPALFSSYVCIFHICFLYQQTSIHPGTHRCSLLSIFFIPNWKWFPNNQFPSLIRNILHPNQHSLKVLISLGIANPPPPLTSSFFGLAHRPPVYPALFYCPEAMDRKAGYVIVSQHWLRQQSVHLTLSKQRESSCWWVVFFSWSCIDGLEWWMVSSLSFSSSALRGFIGVFLLTRHAFYFVFFCFFLIDSIVTVACVTGFPVNIWPSSRSWGQLRFRWRQSDNLISVSLAHFNVLLNSYSL